MFESGRRSFWKHTPGKAENERLNFKLAEPNDVLYNEFSYANATQGEDNFLSQTSSLLSERNSTDFGYAEESYVDNSEAFSDKLPEGFTTEFGGFYINTGKLKLVPLFPKKTLERKEEKKNLPNAKKLKLVPLFPKKTPERKEEKKNLPNTKKLKLVPHFPKKTFEKKDVKKTFPNLKNMVKKPKYDTKQEIYKRIGEIEISTYFRRE